MYLCIYLYIWLLKYKRSATRVFSYFCIHVGKMLLLIWQYSYNRRTESLLDVFFMPVTFTLWELHDIRRIENSVEEKMAIEKIGENDINLWLHSLRPLLLFCHFCHELLPPSEKTYFLNGLVEYDCFESFQLKRLHRNHAWEYFKPRTFSLAKK